MTIMKIIDGLYFTIGMILFNPLTGESKTPDQLNEDDRTTYDACMGAIALLKAQEPRVMTLDELSTNGDDDVIYIETALFIDGKRATEIKPAIFQPDNCSPEEDGYYCIVSSWGNSGFYHEENYGFDWRCWTSRPTDAQREAAPWMT